MRKSSRLIASALVVGGCLTATVATAPAAAAAATLTVTNPSLVFVQGQDAPVITLASDQPSVTWSIDDANGNEVRTGTSPVTNGNGNIRIAGIRPGYYTLTVNAGSGTDETTIPTSFAVLTPLPKGPLDQKFGVGMHLHGGMNDSWLDDAAKVGYGEVRTDISWSQVEVTKGVYTYPAPADAALAELHRLGITPMMLADYGNQYYDDGKTPSDPAADAAFANYASDLLTHYGAYTNQVEVFNEFNGSWFNNGACGTTAACYLPLLQATYAQVKKDHPNATVVGPADFTSTPSTGAKWLQDLFAIGGLKYLNAITYHVYNYPTEPEGTIDADGQAIHAAAAEYGGGDIPQWITEAGWPTSTGQDTLSQQADYLVRAQALAFGNYVTKFFWYDWINDGTDPTAAGQNQGLLTQPAPGVTAPAPKPDLVTQAVMIRALDRLPYTGRDDIGTGAYSYRFGTGLRARRMLWTTDGGSQTVTLKATGPVAVTGEYGQTTVHTPKDGQVTLTINQHPQYVAGAVQGIAASPG